MKKKYDFIIVGSGAGGATIAGELVKKEKTVLMIEKGPYPSKMGSFWDAIKLYDMKKPFYFPRVSKEGTILWQGSVLGGSTVIACGNGMFVLEKELLQLGVDITNEVADVKNDIQVQKTNSQMLSSASKAMLEAAKALGYDFVYTPKVFNKKGKCAKCGNCVLGCIYNNKKWTSLDIIEGIKDRIDILTGTAVYDLVLSKGKVIGVKGKCGRKNIEVSASNVILSAGAYNTPILLNKVGIKEAGGNLSLDLLMNFYTVSKGLTQKNEPIMSLILDKHIEDGFIVSPFIHQAPLTRFIEAGIKGLRLYTENIAGLMVKIKDESYGEVFSDGTFSKKPTEIDLNRLRKGKEICFDILNRISSTKKIVETKVQGAHPAGTAALGKVVNRNFETSISNLFVCDASILPEAPGLPPILTIMALAKKMAKQF